MIHRSLSYEPTPEHRLSRAKWARGVAVVYGTILLLLLTLAGAHRSLGSAGGAVARGHVGDQHLSAPYLQTRLTP